jgi:parvulin-like peptidyl-prolyl isomerase
MRPYRWSAIALLLAAPAAAWLLGGCGGEPEVVARVGNEAITVADFDEAARNSASQYPPLPDTAKVMLLRDLVQRQLLITGAKQSGLYRDTVFLDYRRTEEDRLLRQELFQRMAGGPFAASAEEAEALYQRRNQEVHARVLYAMSREIARAAAAELQHGTDFAVACDRFNPPGSLPPGGDLGFLVPGALVPAIDDALVDAPLGQVVGPIEVPSQGFFYVRVEERRPRDQGPLESQRRQLAAMVRERKQRAAAVRAVEKLKAAYRVKVRREGPAIVMEKLRPDPQRSGPGGILLPPVLTEAERAEVLATWDGGAYTLADAMTDLNQSLNRPNLSMMPAIERWIGSQAMERVALVEARRRHLDREPDIQRRLRERLNNYLLDNYYEFHVLRQVALEPADLRAAYESRAAAFQSLDEVRLLSVVFPDSASAAQLVMHGAHAGNLREAAAMAAPNLRVRDERLRFPTPDPFWSRLYATFQAMTADEYAGPVQTPRGWLVYQMVSKRTRLEPYESLPATVQQSLQATALEIKREARLTALTDSLRRLIPVQENPRALSRVKWPTAGGPMPGGRVRLDAPGAG